MAITANEKVDIVFVIFAKGMYRRWWWANYKSAPKQAALRAEWVGVVGRFSRREIRDGLARWSAAYGPDQPPSPEAFARYLRPVHSAASRQYLNSIKQQLAG